MTPKNERLGASFRDPSGFLFEQDGRLLRQVNRSYQDDYQHLMTGGLYAQLVKKKLLVAHSELDWPDLPPPAYKVIAPERVAFISYPYEWSFSQLKDAALLTLAIQRQALQHGMTLKDASAYNIQFHNGRPILIDTLSFARRQEGAPWVAYRQFCQHFLAPLALMALTDIRLGSLLQNHIDGVPLDLAARLLPARTRWQSGLLFHIHLHARAQQRYAGQATQGRAKPAQVSQAGMTGLLDSLEKAVRGLNWKPAGTDWVDYYQATNYSDQAFQAKKAIVSDWLHQAAPRRVLDLGANTGIFSHLGKDLPDCLVLSTDVDPGAVEVNYQVCKKERFTNILPLLTDLTNPPPAIGWANQERAAWRERVPADVVMALALVHHLAISNNLPLAHIAQFFAALGPLLIIEFVPKEDSQVQRLLASREDIFPDYTLPGLLAAFEPYFVLQAQQPVAGSQRTLCRFARRDVSPSI